MTSSPLTMRSLGWGSCASAQKYRSAGSLDFWETSMAARCASHVPAAPSTSMSCIKKKLLLEISRHFAELVRRVRGMNQRISILFIKQRIQLFFLHGSRSMIKMETLYNEPSATNIYLGASASANLGANEYYCLKGGVASLSSKGLTSCRRLPLLVKS